ncbi:MAG: hypothetical protein LUH51_01900 [Firmicutes bacterium]|nr:hypothetical protein [Bacillota bacterium]
MANDTEDVLKKLERELLAEEEPTADLEAIVREFSGESAPEDSGQAPEPAFEDPEQIHELEGGEIYRNYSNAYGKRAEPAAENPGEEAAQAAPETPASVQSTPEDKLVTALLFSASALCLAASGFLIYWICVIS